MTKYTVERVSNNHTVLLKASSRKNNFKLEAKDVLPNKNGVNNAVFVAGVLDV